MIKVVEFASSVEKKLHKLPSYIKQKLLTWIVAVEEIGLYEVRKTSGFHDEPLKGNRLGQRSIRLNKQWRVIYRIVNDQIEFVLIEEVTPHAY